MRALALKSRNVLPLVAALSVLLVPCAAFAQNVGTNPPADITLENPLGGTTDIGTLLNNIATILRDQVGPPVAGIMILVGALQMLFSAGDPERFKAGRKTILYTVIGYAIIIIGSGITLIIKDALSSH